MRRLTMLQRRCLRSGLPWPALPWPGFTAAALGLALALAPAVVQAVPTDGISTPQPTRVEHFNPDVQVCRPEAIRSGFTSQLQPWADQPAAVQAKLREVQLDMTRSTLRRCVSKGLMDRTQAEQLFLQLSAQGSAPQAPAATTPAAAGSAPRTP